MAFMNPETCFGCARITDARGETCLLPIEYAHDESAYGGSDGTRFRAPFTVETFPESYAAWYSASGYLDCTDWNGPYASEEEAIAEVRAIYGDDEDDEEEESDD